MSEDRQQRDEAIAENERLKARLGHAITLAQTEAERAAANLQATGSLFFEGAWQMAELLLASLSEEAKQWDDK